MFVYEIASEVTRMRDRRRRGEQEVKTSCASVCLCVCALACVCCLVELCYPAVRLGRASTDMADFFCHSLPLDTPLSRAKWATRASERSHRVAENSP